MLLKFKRKTVCVRCKSLQLPGRKMEAKPWLLSQATNRNRENSLRKEKPSQEWKWARHTRKELSMDFIASSLAWVAQAFFPPSMLCLLDDAKIKKGFQASSKLTSFMLILISFLQYPLPSHSWIIQKIMYHIMAKYIKADCMLILI